MKCDISWNEMPLAETEDEVNKCQGNLISLCTFLCISIKGAVKGPMTNDDWIPMNLDELEMNFKEITQKYTMAERQKHRQKKNKNTKRQ